MNSLNDIELERTAINSILRDETLIDKLIEETDENFFTDKISLKAYRWMKKKYSNSKRISLVRMKRETDIDIKKLIEPGFNIIEFDEVINLLDKLKMRRELIYSARKIINLAQEEKLDKKDYAHKSQEIIFKSTSDFSNENNIHEMTEVLNEVFEDISLIQEGKAKLTGLGTGFPSVDRHTSGLQEGHLTMVGGKSSMGKTAFTLKLAQNILQRDKKVLIISLEMIAKEVGKRLLALDRYVPTSAYNRKLTESQKQNMDASLGRLMKYNLTISDKRGLKVEDIKAICRNVFRKNGKYDLIIIDYLQRIILRNSRVNLAKKVGNAVSNLRDLAGLLEVPILLVSQLKRSGHGRPSLSDLRDSGEIEENADEVWFPYRPKYDQEINNQDTPENAVLIFAKGRTSGEGVAKFIWYPSIQCWRDYLIEKTEGPLRIIKKGFNT